jgi:hypothetical protein
MFPTPDLFAEDQGIEGAYDGFCQRALDRRPSDCLGLAILARAVKRTQRRRDDDPTLEPGRSSNADRDGKRASAAAAGTAPIVSPLDEHLHVLALAHWRGVPMVLCVMHEVGLIVGRTDRT